MILTCSISDVENSFEEEKDVIKNVMVVTVYGNNVKKRYFLGDEPKINSNNLFAFDVKYSAIFKSTRDENDDIFYEKFKTLKADSLNVSNVESNSVVESLISKEDNFINTDVLNLINSPMTTARKNLLNKDNTDIQDLRKLKKLDFKKEENLLETLTSPNIKSTDLVKENPKLEEQINSEIPANKLKSDILKGSVTDEERDISSKDSFTSDLSQSKNYIPKEMLLMRNSANYPSTANNYIVTNRSQNNLIGNCNNNPRATSIKRGEIDSNVINYYDFDKILNDSSRQSPNNSNNILMDTKALDNYSNDKNTFPNQIHKNDNRKIIKMTYDEAKPYGSYLIKQNIDSKLNSLQANELNFLGKKEHQVTTTPMKTASQNFVNFSNLETINNMKSFNPKGVSDLGTHTACNNVGPYVNQNSELNYIESNLGKINKISVKNFEQEFQKTESFKKTKFSGNDKEININEVAKEKNKAGKEDLSLDNNISENLNAKAKGKKIIDNVKVSKKTNSNKKRGSSTPSETEKLKSSEYSNKITRNQKQKRKHRSRNSISATSGREHSSGKKQPKNKNTKNAKKKNTKFLSESSNETISSIENLKECNSKHAHSDSNFAAAGDQQHQTSSSKSLVSGSRPVLQRLKGCNHKRTTKRIESGSDLSSEESALRANNNKSEEYSDSNFSVKKLKENLLTVDVKVKKDNDRFDNLKVKNYDTNLFNDPGFKSASQAKALGNDAKICKKVLDDRNLKVMNNFNITNAENQIKINNNNNVVKANPNFNNYINNKKPNNPATGNENLMMNPYQQQILNKQPGFFNTNNNMNFNKIPQYAANNVHSIHNQNNIIPINNFNNPNAFQANTINGNIGNQNNKNPINGINNVPNPNNFRNFNQNFMNNNGFPNNNLNMMPNYRNIGGVNGYVNPINPNMANYYMNPYFNNENINNFPNANNNNPNSINNHNNYMVKNQNYFAFNNQNNPNANNHTINYSTPNQNLIGNNNTNNINNNIFCNPNIVISNEICDNPSNKIINQNSDNFNNTNSLELNTNNNYNNNLISNFESSSKNKTDKNVNNKNQLGVGNKRETEAEIKSQSKKEKAENKQKAKLRSKKEKKEKAEIYSSSINCSSSDAKKKFSEKEINLKKFKEDSNQAINSNLSAKSSLKISSENSNSNNNCTVNALTEKKLKTKKEEIMNKDNSNNKKSSKNKTNDKKKERKAKEKQNDINSNNIKKPNISSNDGSNITQRISSSRTVSATNQAADKQTLNFNCNQIKDDNNNQNNNLNDDYFKSESNSVSNNDIIVSNLKNNNNNKNNEKYAENIRNEENCENNSDSQKPIAKKKKENKKKIIKTIDYLNMNDEDLANIAIIICRDQAGCRYLQKKIEDDYKLGSELIYPRIKDHILSLVYDTFGNYLVQKIIENIHQDKMSFILRKITPKFLEIGTNAFGTRIIQKIIENIKDENNLNYFNKLLESNIVDFIKDINGNHIIQKYLSEVPSPKNKFLYDVIINNIIEVSTDKFGCCVIQKGIDAADKQQKSELIKSIIENTIILMSDPYGNYVVQYILSLKEPDVIYQISNTFKSYVIYLSKQKFSSNVIEKCFDYSHDRTRLLLIKELCIPKTITELILDAFGNYVIQKALHYCKEPYYTIFINSIGPILEKLKFLNFGHKLYLKLINTYPELNAYVNTNINNNEMPNNCNNERNFKVNDHHTENNNFNIYNNNNYKNNVRTNDVRKKNFNNNNNMNYNKKY